MAFEKWKLCAIDIDDTVIGQITDSVISNDLSEILADDTGSIYNRKVAINGQDIRIRFTTNAIKTALGKIGLLGTTLSAGNTAKLYFQHFTNAGNIATNDATIFEVTVGQCIWRGLNATNDAPATATFEVIATSTDGSSAPWTKTTAQTDPTCTTDEVYITDGSTGVQSIQIDTGIELIADRGDDDMYMTFSSVAKIQPKVILSQTTMGTMTPAVAIGSVSLRDLVSGAASRGAAPITFTFNEELEHAREIGGPDAMTTYEITPVWDGTNAPIVLTGVA
tara:strand:+ start:415 stop:1251 length:837 start_codon:yes stop_codon:yes gene_type:complete